MIAYYVMSKKINKIGINDYFIKMLRIKWKTRNLSYKFKCSFKQYLIIQ